MKETRQLDLGSEELVPGADNRRESPIAFPTSPFLNRE
jgi:hypothetical protein